VVPWPGAVSTLQHCLNDETMAAIADGTLGADARLVAIGHVEYCDDCRRVLSHLLSRSPGDASTMSSDDGPPAPRAAIAPGEAIGRYVVQDCIGSGSMGIVYTARDPDLGRKVAVKVLRSDPGAASSQGARLRLQREAQAMAQLSHPNVVAIYDVGVHGDDVFFAMELIKGGTLTEWLRRSPRSWRDVVAAFRRAGAGLAAAHAVGLIHRDFKPDNVLVGDDGRVCVTDFGLARPLALPARVSAPTLATGVVDSMTRTGAVVGTPAYMAPEQLEGAAADARADLFSFSVAFYEALYGERPFAASSIPELAAAVARGAIRSAPARTRVPAWLRRIVVRGLRAAPEERPESVAALLAAIDARLARRRRIRIAALAVAGAGAVALVALWPGESTPRPAPAPASPGAAASGGPPRAVAVTELPLPASSSDEARRAYQRGLLHVRVGVTPGHDFARAAELDPAMAEAHLRYAIEEFWEVPVDARAHLERAVELEARLGPRDQRVLAAAQGWMHSQPADREAYARLLGAAQAEFPLDAELAFLAGGALLETGDRAAALVRFDRAIALDRGFGAVYRSKSDLLAYQGRFDDALATIEQCTREAPDATNCLAERALIDELSGNCARVEQDAQRILAREPGSSVGYYLLALASYAEGRSLEAVRELLRERLARMPDALRPRFEAWQLWALDVLTGDFDAARDRARELDRSTAPDADRRLHARAAHWWAIASIESGRPAEAADGARRFLVRKDAWIAEPRAEDFSLLRDLTPRLLLAERIGGVLAPEAFEAERTKWIELWERAAVPASRPFIWLHGYAAVADTAADAAHALAAAPRFGMPAFTPYTLGDAFIGTVYHRAGHTAEALPYLQRAARSCMALETPFEHTQVQLVLAEALAALGRRDQACGPLGVVQARWGHARPRSITADRAAALAHQLGCK
jgi:eukaryotic-like serine/threonine-protein kinase